MAERKGARFVFITGLSGSGKTLAMKALEDAGFFCVDNLPAKLILSFAELTAQGGENIDRVAIAADIRERGFLKDFPDAHRQARGAGFSGDSDIPRSPRRDPGPPIQRKP